MVGNKPPLSKKLAEELVRRTYELTSLDARKSASISLELAYSKFIDLQLEAYATVHSTVSIDLRSLSSSVSADLVPTEKMRELYESFENEHPAYRLSQGRRQQAKEIKIELANALEKIEKLERRMTDGLPYNYEVKVPWLLREIGTRLRGLTNNIGLERLSQRIGATLNQYQASESNDRGRELLDRALSLIDDFLTDLQDLAIDDSSEEGLTLSELMENLRDITESERHFLRNQAPLFNTANLKGQKMKALTEAFSDPEVQKKLSELGDEKALTAILEVFQLAENDENELAFSSEAITQLFLSLDPEASNLQAQIESLKNWYQVDTGSDPMYHEKASERETMSESPLKKQAQELGSAALLGAKLGATQVAGDVLLDLAKDLSEDLPWLQDALANPEGREAVKLFLAVLIHSAATHTEFVPKSDAVKKVMELQVSLGTMQLLVGRAEMIQNALGKLASAGEKLASVEEKARLSQPATRARVAAEPEEVEVEIDEDVVHLKTQSL